MDGASPALRREGELLMCCSHRAPALSKNLSRSGGRSSSPCPGARGASPACLHPSGVCDGFACAGFATLLSAWFRAPWRFSAVPFAVRWDLRCHGLSNKRRKRPRPQHRRMLRPRQRLSTRLGDSPASRARSSPPLSGASAASTSCLYSRGGGD